MARSSSSSSSARGLFSLLAKALKLVLEVPFRALVILQRILAALLGGVWDAAGLSVPLTFRTVRLLLAALGRTLLSAVWAAAYALGKVGDASSATVRSFRNQEVVVIALVLVIFFLLLRTNQ